MRKSQCHGQELFDYLRAECERIRIETKRFEERRVAFGAEVDRVLRKHRDGSTARSGVVALNVEPIEHDRRGGPSDHGPSRDLLDQ